MSARCGNAEPHPAFQKGSIAMYQFLAGTAKEFTEGNADRLTGSFIYEGAPMILLVEAAFLLSLLLLTPALIEVAVRGLRDFYQAYYHDG
jgi:hypothetical protein